MNSSQVLSNLSEPVSENSKRWTSGFKTICFITFLYILGSKFGGGLLVLCHLIAFAVCFFRPEFISLAVLVILPLRLEISPMPVVGPFHLQWYEVLLAVCLLRLGSDMVTSKMTKPLFIGAFMIMLITTSQAFFKGFARSFIPGIVLRDTIGCFLVGFYAAGQYLREPFHLSAIIRYAASIWIIGLFVRILLVAAGLEPTALGVFYGDQAAIFSSIAISYMIFKATHHKSQLKSICAYTVSLIIIVVTIVTGGRIAGISVTLALLISIWQNRGSSFVIGTTFGKLVFVSSFVLILGISGILPHHATERINELFSGLSSQLAKGSLTGIRMVGNSEWRIRGNLDALSNWQEEPLVGIGWGTRMHTDNLGYFLYGKDPATGYFRPGTIHNTILIILVGSGILGLGGFSFFLFRTMKYILKYSKDDAGRKGNALFLPVILSGFMISLVQPTFASANAAWLWCFYGLWLRFASLDENKKKQVLINLWGPDR